jgi:parvulin-like peptidyl-prolyl isomerase
MMFIDIGEYFFWKTIYHMFLYMLILADKIKCSHILVKKQNEALSIIERLKKGESFDKLAKELSIDRGAVREEVT